MNSNRLHNIFKRRELSKKDIHDYSSSSNEVKREIELKSLSDDFNQDAFEGWESVGFNTNTMNKLDNKFKPANTSGVIITSTVIISILGLTSILLLNNQEKHNSTPLAKIEQAPLEEELILEETDIILPQEINEMKEAVIAEQVSAPKMKQDFNDKKNITPVKVEIESLPPLKINEIDQVESFELSTRFHAKEIYLHNLKLIDYRAYRSAPKVRVKQLTLPGTSADKENQYSDAIEESKWEDVDIPYHEYIDKSVAIFEKGSYKRALARFENIIGTYSDDINANFYGGLCLFNLQEYDKALTYFNRALQSSYNNFDEEVQWMIAQCYQKSGNKSDAKSVYKTIVDQNGFYAEQAKEKLSNL